MGSSMGGYAAIAFSKYLRCDTALAYSPQNEITIQSDPRFAGHVENIEWVYPISAETIADACKFFVVYDNKDLYDKMHAERLRSIIPAERYVEILFVLCRPRRGFLSAGSRPAEASQPERADWQSTSALRAKKEPQAIAAISRHRRRAFASKTASQIGVSRAAHDQGSPHDVASDRLGHRSPHAISVVDRRKSGSTSPFQEAV